MQVQAKKGLSKTNLLKRILPFLIFMINWLDGGLNKVDGAGDYLDDNPVPRLFSETGFLQALRSKKP